MRADSRCPEEANDAKFSGLEKVGFQKRAGFLFVQLYRKYTREKPKFCIITNIK
jgi:hypothetical protein